MNYNGEKNPAGCLNYVTYYVTSKMPPQANYIAASRIRYEIDVTFFSVTTSTIQFGAIGGKIFGWTRQFSLDRLFGHMKCIIDLLPASYNLAAIFALNRQKDKALELLKRHFFQFERYQRVREKEMMEARVDAVFDSIRTDQAFLALTAGADGKLPIPVVKAAVGTNN